MSAPRLQVAISPIGAVACATTVWRVGRQLHVTAIVKATFSFVPGGPAALVDPTPIQEGEVHFRSNPGRSVVATSDLAPRLPRVDVVLTGHAHAPSGEPATVVVLRLVIARDDAAKPLIDKTLHAVGDRTARGITPFKRMPVLYDKAFGGIGHQDNPLGVGVGVDLSEPNIVDPAAPRRTAGFGPISRTWPLRKQLCTPEERKGIEQSIVEIPSNFDWSYFQAAPLDQRIEALHGDEWIVLGGLHPTLPLVKTRLPGARAAARFYGLTRRGRDEGKLVELRADTLSIDCDEQRCSVTWRGEVEVASESALASMRVAAGVALEGAPIAWPPPAPSGPAAFAPGSAVPAPGPSSPGSGPRPPYQPIAPSGEVPPTTITLNDEDLEIVSSRQLAAEAPAKPAPRPAAVSPPPRAAPTPLALLERTAIMDEQGPFTQKLAVTQAPGAPLHALAGTLIMTPEEHAEVTNRLKGSAKLAPLEADEPEEEDEGTLVRPLAPAGFDGPAAGPLRKPSAAALGPLALRGPSVIEDDTTTAQLGAPSGTPSELRRAAREPQPSEAIRVVNATPFAVVRLPWQVRPPSFSITVLVKGTFDLVPGGAAKPRAVGDPPAGDLHHDGDARRSLIHASDYVIFKPKADVTLVGHAHPPGGATSMDVRFRFGDHDNAFDRRIRVFGERRWRLEGGALAPSDPLEFTKIPLRYEGAFGGPEHGANPVGVGHAAAGAGEGARLPWLEDPRQLIAGPTDAPPPACFAPIAAGWAQRASKLGTYDAKWRRTRAPYYPRDFDWAYCQSAPGPQQLEYLRGDEPFEIVGMHPDHPTIEGTLPLKRVRCFAQMTDKAGRAFQEVSLRLDTAAFDADAMTVSLGWRGLLEVTREDAPEIESLFVLAEDQKATPATLEEAHVRFLWALVPLDAGPASSARSPVEVTGPTQLSAATIPDERRREFAAALGLPGSDDCEGTMVAPAPGPAEPAAPAGRDAAPRAPLSEVAAMVLARLDAGEGVAGLDLEGADLSDLDLDGRSLAGANLKGARLLRCSLRNSNLEDTQLEEADLTGADLAGSNLNLANFHGARLIGAVFDGASIARADFADANGARASFQGAAGDYAVFASGDWTEARFDGLDVANANFMGATLDRAVFTRAKLPRALLFQARAIGAVFDGVTMAAAIAERATLVESSFSSIAAEGSNWQRSIVSRSTFEGAMLKAASFIGATCLGTVFTRADLAKGCLRDANLEGAILFEADLTDAGLDGADLSGADLRGATLPANEPEVVGAKPDLAGRDEAAADKPD